MPPKKGTTLETWQRLLPPLAANSADMPHAETLCAKLERIRSRAQEIVRRQAALAAERQELTREFDKLRDEGNRTAAQLRKVVTEHYGPRSEKLIEFGIQPFRGRKRKAAPTESSDAAEILSST